jgi:hypothetical protein
MQTSMISLQRPLAQAKITNRKKGSKWTSEISLIKPAIYLLSKKVWLFDSQDDK